MTKSTIADLPSTPVQSIHIECSEPVELGDHYFEWRNNKKVKVKMPPAKKKKESKQITARVPSDDSKTLGKQVQSMLQLRKDSMSKLKRSKTDLKVDSRSRVRKDSQTKLKMTKTSSKLNIKRNADRGGTDPH